MRILRFNMQAEPVSAARTGVLLGGVMIGDLRAGYAAYLAQTRGDTHAREIAALRFPPNINDILNMGGVTHAAIAETAAWLAQTLEKNSLATWRFLLGGGTCDVTAAACVANRIRRSVLRDIVDSEGH